MATFFYNDLFLHPGAEISLRELGIFSSYVAMSIVPLQLKWHANGALNNGWSGDQLAEVIEVLAPFVGVANAYQSSVILNEVLEARELPKIDPHRLIDWKPSLSSLTAMITLGTAPDLLKVELSQMKRAGVSEMEVFETIDSLEKFVGLAVASEARNIAHTVLERSSS